MKATNVDGVYTADPKRDAKATRYTDLTHDEAIAKELAVMDPRRSRWHGKTAFPLSCSPSADAGRHSRGA